MCSALEVRLCIVTGPTPPQPGMVPTTVVPDLGVEGGEQRVPVWIWSHMSFDGSGNGAEHFSYICEDRTHCFSCCFNNYGTGAIAMLTACWQIKFTHFHSRSRG